MNILSFKRWRKIKEDGNASSASTSGMGPVVSAQPSSIPGDAAGSTIGSGDLGSVPGKFLPRKYYQKTPRKKKNKIKENVSIPDSVVNIEFGDNDINFQLNFQTSLSGEIEKKSVEGNIHSFSFESFDKELKGIKGIFLNPIIDFVVVRNYLERDLLKILEKVPNQIQGNKPRLSGELESLILKYSRNDEFNFNDLKILLADFSESVEIVNPPMFNFRLKGSSVNIQPLEIGGGWDYSQAKNEFLEGETIPVTCSGKLEIEFDFSLEGKDLWKDVWEIEFEDSRILKFQIQHGSNQLFDDVFFKKSQEEVLGTLGEFERKRIGEKIYVNWLEDTYAGN